MYSYIKGSIKDIGCNYIVIDNHDLGYLIYVANPYSYQLNEIYTVYIYSHIRDDEYSLYGFTSKEELELFLKLISVKGLGPKVAMPIFATGSIKGITDAITRENILYLKKFPKIGDRLARQIILDLKGKLNDKDIVKCENDELVEALMALGYKNRDIMGIIVNVDRHLSLEEQIKAALKLLLK